MNGKNLTPKADGIFGAAGHMRKHKGWAKDSVKAREDKAGLVEYFENRWMNKCAFLLHDQDAEDKEKESKTKSKRGKGDKGKEKE